MADVMMASHIASEIAYRMVVPGGEVFCCQSRVVQLPMLGLYLLNFPSVINAKNGSSFFCIGHGCNRCCSKGVCSLWVCVSGRHSFPSSQKEHVWQRKTLILNPSDAQRYVQNFLNKWNWYGWVWWEWSWSSLFLPFSLSSLLLLLVLGENIALASLNSMQCMQLISS